MIRKKPKKFSEERLYDVKNLALLFKCNEASIRKHIQKNHNHKMLFSGYGIIEWLAERETIGNGIASLYHKVRGQKKTYWPWRYLTIREAAQLIGVNAAFIRRCIAENQLNATRISKSLLRIAEPDFITWQQGCGINLRSIWRTSSGERNGIHRLGIHRIGLRRNDLLKIKDAAKSIGVCEKFLRGCIENGTLNAAHFGRLIKISIPEFIVWLDSCASDSNMKGETKWPWCYMDVENVAKILNSSPSAIRQEMKAGRLRFHRFGRLVKIAEPDIVAWSKIYGDGTLSH